MMTTLDRIVRRQAKITNQMQLFWFTYSKQLFTVSSVFNWANPKLSLINTNNPKASHTELEGSFHWNSVQKKTTCS